MGLAIYSLWHREVVRFLTDRSRVFSSVGQPIIFWLLFAGALNQSSFRPDGMSYGEYFFPGTLAMIVLFTAIFSTITVIEDRKEGFLQGVLVSPVPRSAIALGKIMGASTLAIAHGLVFFLLAPFAGVPIDLLSGLASFGVLLLIALALTGLGFTLAWVMDSTAGYHGIMMLFLMPMLLLSGAFFPAAGAHPVMAFLMAANPLTYGVAALRYAFYGAGTDATAALPAQWLCLLVTAAFAFATFSLATWVVLRRSSRVAQ
ncbi:MAG: ABC transporter permease [Planctomycetota bacterium]|jgi:ABC-2 type transport system permease protein